MAGEHHPVQRLTASALVPAPLVAVARQKASSVTVGIDTFPFNGSSNGNGTTIRQNTEHREAWTAYDKIPEVKTLVQGTANLLAQCRLFVGRREWSNGHEIDVPGRNSETLNVDPYLGESLVAAAEDALSRYVDKTGQQTGLLRNLAVGFQVVGECRMVGYYVDDKGQPTTASRTSTERWVVVAPDAIVKQRVQGGEYWELQVTRENKIKLPTAIVHRFDWEGGRYPDEPSAWVIGALDVCRDLRSFTMALRAAARSGIPADLFIVPTEASPQAINPQGWGPGDEGAVVTAQSAADEWATKVEELIGDYAMKVLEDMNAGNTIVPGVLAVEGRFVEFFNKISFARQVDRGIGELVRDARVRLAAAADCAPEMLKGLGQTNRWNGAQIADDEYRRYYKPKADAIVDEWTQLLLWADLKERGFSPDEYRKIRVLVDSSAVVADPDFTKIAPMALDRGAIGPAGFRMLLHIPESAAPTPDELAWIEKMKGKSDTSATGKGDTGSPDEVNPVDESKGAVMPPGPDATADDWRSFAAAEHAKVPDDLATRLASIEADTRARLQEACEAALDKALEKGAAHLRNWARKAGGDLRVLSANPEFPAVVKPVVLATLADENTDDEDDRREVLFAAALVALLLAWRRIAGGAFTSALTTIGKTLPQEEIDAAIERSAEVLRDSMMILADERLFGQPGLPAPPVGELNRLRIPSPLIQRVLATAGGSPGIEAGIIATAEAALGMVFGPLIERLLPARQGLLWVYGDPLERTQPFEPHEELGGEVFTGPQDARLAGSVFSASAFWYPGDHGGCLCMWVPVLQ